MDVAPTILDLVGINPPEEVDGVSLAPLLRGEETAVPDAAWAYAAAQNRGVALRLDNRLKMTFNNSVWPPAAGARELFDLEFDPAEARNRAAEDERGAGLATAIDDYLIAASAGLRLQVQAGDGRLQGGMTGAAVRPLGTKAIGMDGHYLGWIEIGRASLDVPAGRSFTIVFEKVFGSRLELEGELEHRGSVADFDIVFDVDGLEGADGLLLTDGRWQRIDRRLAAGEVGFAVYWRGGSVAENSNAADADHELAEQLRALGYIE